MTQKNDRPDPLLTFRRHLPYLRDATQSVYCLGLLMEELLIQKWEAEEGEKLLLDNEAMVGGIYSAFTCLGAHMGKIVETLEEVLEGCDLPSRPGRGV